MERIHIIYLDVVGDTQSRHKNIDNFKSSRRRFLNSYLENTKPNTCDLSILRVNEPTSADSEVVFPKRKFPSFSYNGGGRDIGAFQWVASLIEQQRPTLFIGSNSYFTSSNWVERFSLAVAEYGEGLYGPMASFQSNPHIRTCAFLTTPRLLSAYPMKVTSRELGYEFEHGTENFTKFVQESNFPAVMVTKNGFHLESEWRDPENIFRRGDQSNCLIWDRHTRIYSSARLKVRTELSKQADGISTKPSLDRLLVRKTMTAIRKVWPR